MHGSGVCHGSGVESRGMVFPSSFLVAAKMRAVRATSVFTSPTGGLTAGGAGFAIAGAGCTKRSGSAALSATGNNDAEDFTASLTVTDTSGGVTAKVLVVNSAEGGLVTTEAGEFCGWLISKLGALSVTVDLMVSGDKSEEGEAGFCDMAMPGSITGSTTDGFSLG